MGYLGLIVAAGMLDGGREIRGCGWDTGTREGVEYCRCV